MAKRRRRSRNKDFVVLRFNGELSLGTLGTGAVIAADLEPAGDRAFHAISMDVTAVMKDFTAGEGPIAVGVGNGIYTVTQIKEWFDSGDGFDQGNPVVSQEQARRMIRDVGIFNGSAAEETLWDGKPRRVKLGFDIPQSITIEMHAVNMTGATLTTGAEIIMYGKVYARWI